MPKTFVIGDIHGSYRALLQCLEKSQFNYLEDHLICLGDVADGWPETRESIDELLKIKNLKYILGNHDFWTLNWMETGYPEQGWIDQGGIATINSYTKDIPENHIAFLRKHHHIIFIKISYLFMLESGWTIPLTIREFKLSCGIETLRDKPKLIKYKMVVKPYKL